MSEHADAPPKASPRLSHPAFAGSGGTPLGDARLSDQQRLAVVLQGAAVLSHLDHGGLHLPGGFDEARLGGDAVLVCGRRPEPGRGVEPAPDVLLRLLRRLFRAGDQLAGRGLARGAARRLMELWQRPLAPASPDRAVAQVLEAAPFLWRPQFESARGTLAAQHHDGDASHLWVAGPSGARRRLLARAPDLDTLAGLLAGPRAFELWEGVDAGDDPAELVARRSWRKAVALWRHEPPADAKGAEAYARALHARGLFAQALAALKGHTGLAAEVLRLRCQSELGQIDAALESLRRLEAAEPGGPEVLELAEAAVRLLGRRGLHQASRDWVARALRAAGRRRRPRWRAELLAAEADWDVQDFDSMAERLAEVEAARDDPETSGRWHQVAALLAMTRKDGDAVIAHNTAILRRRRSLTRVEAARRWNDVGFGRHLAGDLAGAERAYRHVLRLLDDTEGPLRETLGLVNLASVRVRRGRPAGVAEALETSIAANRRTGNVRGLVADLELQVRLDLVQGRPKDALARRAEAGRLADENGFPARQKTLDLLAARAHGWLGRPERAAECLERATPDELAALEPEERPAVLALAGRAEEAAAEADGTPFAELWSAHLSGVEPRPAAWDELRHLEPYRAARLVFDVETLHPGIVPPIWVRRAVVALQAVGADAFAVRLEGRALSPWHAVARYLGNRAPEAEDAAVLFADAGYPDVRLTARSGGRERVLIDGRGGDETLEKPWEDGRMVLEAPLQDAALAALFALVRRDLKDPADDSHKRRGGGSTTILGESPELKKALRRLDRLARGEMPVLILGESGTGKELAARRVHEKSDRAGGPFHPLNCAAVSETLIQSELFGHVRGAFTGADRDRQGIFESARGGTVFLDEIGDLPLQAQGKLLRVLQEGEIRRVGESFARKVDVRIVAATHRNLARRVKTGDFRQDLFFRLKVALIELPPLRERGQDVMLLAEHFLRLSSTGTTPKLSSEARALVLRYGWPGNVRELQSIMKVAAELAGGGEIEARDIEVKVEESNVPEGDYHQLLDRFRRQLVNDALAASGGSRAAAARRLGLSRQALSYLVKQLGLT